VQPGVCPHDTVHLHTSGEEGTTLLHLLRASVAVLRPVTVLCHAPAHNRGAPFTPGVCRYTVWGCAPMTQCTFIPAERRARRCSTCCEQAWRCSGRLVCFVTHLPTTGVRHSPQGCAVTLSGGVGEEISKSNRNCSTVTVVTEFSFSFTTGVRRSPQGCAVTHFTYHFSENSVKITHKFHPHRAPLCRGEMA
jgi:hypothetical protein